MLSIAVLLLFFAVLGFMVLGNKNQAYVWVFAGMVLFPPCIYFTQSPQISPLQVLLYGFFALSLVWNRSALMDGIFKNPLRVPLFLLLCSLVMTAVFTGEGGKGVYNALRLYMENYAFLIIAYVGGLAYKEIRIEDKWLYPVVVLFVLGVMEFVLKSNFIFPTICKAFPFYDGYYDLTDSISAARSYRNRIFITATHPTVLGSFLCSALMMFTCRMKYVSWDRGRNWIVWGLLLVLVALSGSRTALVCSLLGLAIFVFMKVNARIKMLLIVIAGFAIAAYAPKVVEQFDVEGQGSSMSMRQEQLLFSYVHFMNSPIYGNGVRFTSKYVMERDTYNDRVTDSSIGGLESIIFFQLIDYGIVGIVAYVLLFLVAFIYFFRRRQSSHAQAGLLVTITFFIFACLSGEIGGNNTFAYMLMGYCMGACRVEEEDEAEEEERKEKELEAKETSVKEEVKV